MNILKRLFGKSEQRAACPSWDALSGHGTATGRLVSPRAAENLSTVLACVQAISTAIASLPAYLYRMEGKVRVEDTAHPLADLIRRGPNEKQTWPDFVEFVMSSAVMRGNALVEIVTDAAGRVLELKPIPWEWVSVQVLPSGRLAYDVTEITSIYGGQGRFRRLLEGEVMHLRDRTDDGLLGKSRLQRAAAVVAAGVSVQEFAESMYRNGASPSGALESDAKLAPEAYDRLKQQFNDAYTGPQNARKVMLLESGLHWKQISVSPEDAELLSSRRFTTEELARIFQVPPPMVGIWDHSTFTNSETAGKWFATFTIGPWCRKLEAEFARSVLSAADRATHQIEFDLSGFLRGDHGARWQGYQIAVSNGILTPNEIREAEGWNPRPGGDDFPGKQTGVTPGA